MKRGHRLYSVVDRRYFEGVFHTREEVIAYATYLGLFAGDFRIDSGSASMLDVVPYL